MPAFGRSERLGEDKLWADVGGEPVLALTLRTMREADCLDQLVVVAPRERHAAVRELAARTGWPGVELVEGGQHRALSVAAGLQRCAGAELVCVHDGARPLAPPRLFIDVVAAARESGAAIAAIACVDTIKQVAGTHVVATLERSRLVSVQTPQAFEAGLLRRAHQRAQTDGVRADDDSALVERLGAVVTVVPGDPRNLKITTRFDLEILRGRVLGAPT